MLKKPQELRPYQKDCIDAIRADWERGINPTLATLATGLGKALSVDTRVLTPGGYKRMGDVVVGDKVIGSDGKPTTVIGVYRQGEREAYRVTFSDGVSVVCDGDHLWSVRTKYDKLRGKSYRCYTTLEILNRGLTSQDGWRWFIPMVQPIEFTSQELSIDPYLLGVLIGDGGLNRGVPAISSADDDLLDRVSTLLPDGVRLRYSDQYDWRITGGVKGRPNPLTEKLRQLGLWGTKSVTKFIPSIYLFTDIESRIKLLQGLMDTDGYVNGKDGNVSFCTVSPQLAKDFAFLVQSLGGIARIGTKRTTGQLAYRMSVILPNGIEPFWLARKRNIWKPRTKYFPTRAIASIEPCGRAEMVCIAVDAPDSLYVIEHAVVTHNTTIIAELVRRTVNPKTDRALALAHTQEIVYQLHDRIENQFAELEYWYTVNRQLVPGIGIEMGDHRAASARIVVGTWQTLRSDKRLAELLQHGVITHVFYDEAHHLAADNEGFRLLDALREANPDIRVVGFTATPKRTDNKALAAVFKNICFSYSILDGISSGYLCPAVRKVIRTGIDLSGVKITRGDYAENQLASVLEATNWLDLAFQAYKEHLHDAGRKTLAFFPTVGMSRQFVAKCREAGIGAAHIDATTKRADRLLILRQYQRGDLKVVSNYNILCLDAETEILTSDGWVGMDAMTYEHKVANWDNGRVFFDNPKFIVRRPRKPGERMVVLETPRRSIRVTEDHRMLFKKRYQQDYYIVHAGELVGVEGELPISGYAEPADVAPEQPNMPSARAIAARIRSTAYTYRKNGMDAVTARVEAETAVTARAAMRYKNPSELTADECRLIGFWIGDGTRSELQSGGVEYVFTQSTVYPNIIRWFDGVLERIGLDFRKREVAPHGNVANTTIRWSLPRGTGFGIQKRYGLFPLEPYLNKRGSKLFWGLNAEQFAALIEGFWYADGLHGKAESAPDFYQVSNTNYELLSLLQAIAVCRGFSASITVGTNHLVNPAHKVIYHLRIAHWRGHQMTRHTLHFEDAAWRDEMVWCVTSTTGNIITRRRGTVTVTGNTEGFDAPQTSGILDARPTNSSTVKTQMWGRGLRLSPATGKTDCLILSLAADDTRVLDQGSLLGKMKTCKVCRAEFYYGFRACPACGTPVGTEKQEKEEPETIGSGMVVKPKRGIMEGLVEEISSIFSDTVAAWHKGEDEYLSVGLGFDEGAMVIAPPTWNVDKAERLRERIDRGLYMLNSLPVGDPYRELALEHIDMLRRELLRAENFTLYYVSKKGDVEYVKANSDVTSLIVSSDAEVVARAGGNRYQVDKNAGWRMVQASEAQRNLLSRFGIAATPSMTKGQAAALLTHAMYVRHVKTFIENDVLPEPKTERVA